MPIEQLTYTQIAERLGISSEAARAMVKRRRLPRLRTNGRKTLVAIDLEEAQHKPLPARSPRGHQPISDVVATLKAKIAQLEQLEAELDASEERSPGLQADFERECERAGRLVTTQDRLVAELEALQAAVAFPTRATPSLRAEAVALMRTEPSATSLSPVARRWPPTPRISTPTIRPRT